MCAVKPSTLGARQPSTQKQTENARKTRSTNELRCFGVSCLPIFSALCFTISSLNSSTSWFGHLAGLSSSLRAWQISFSSSGNRASFLALLPVLRYLDSRNVSRPARVHSSHFMSATASAWHRSSNSRRCSCSASAACMQLSRSKSSLVVGRAVATTVLGLMKQSCVTSMLTRAREPRATTGPSQNSTPSGKASLDSSHHCPCLQIVGMTTSTVRSVGPSPTTSKCSLVAQRSAAAAPELPSGGKTIPNSVPNALNVMDSLVGT